MQRAPDHPRPCAPRTRWSTQKVSNYIQHKRRGAADPSRAGFRKKHSPTEQKTLQKRGRKERERQVRQEPCFQRAQARLFLPSFAVGAKDAQCL